MPDEETLERAHRDEEEGKSPSTQAGEFVREEMHHIREGKHGAASTKQAIAIGLSKARRAGVKLPQPSERSASSRTRAQAKRDAAKGRSGAKPSRTRSRAVTKALKTRRARGRFASESFATGEECGSQARVRITASLRCARGANEASGKPQCGEKRWSQAESLDRSRRIKVHFEQTLFV
jgi:hypothetical protein